MVRISYQHNADISMEAIQGLSELNNYIFILNSAILYLSILENKVTEINACVSHLKCRSPDLRDITEIYIKSQDLTSLSSDQHWRHRKQDQQGRVLPCGILRKENFIVDSLTSALSNYGCPQGVDKHQRNF